MERLLSHEIDRSMLIPGDHIYTYRWGYIYSHHGIYVGGDRVVHFKMANLLLVPSNRPRCKNCGYDRRAQLADAVEVAPPTSATQQTLSSIAPATRASKVLVSTTWSRTTARALLFTARQAPA
ncbi:uncharacterized protein LOC21402649 isoform X2 [Morus notabilis]|uniref:uncharacterized protein LOC21402649 isoform X2 n=1 Tax=Morus notabilis TaxID=981085 RepID=UPI000CECF9D0|nr:uncharacterized protein LOC21402649 isoform X2 [Morus notabilis]